MDRIAVQIFEVYLERAKFTCFFLTPVPNQLNGAVAEGLQSSPIVSVVHQDDGKCGIKCN